MMRGRGGRCRLRIKCKLCRSAHLRDPVYSIVIGVNNAVMYT